jgi:cytochrome c oxidase subunit 2
MPMSHSRAYATAARRAASTAAALSVAGCSDAPMNYMVAHGPVAGSERTLGWWLLVVSAIVVVVITLLVLGGARHRPPDSTDTELAPTAGRGGLLWIYFGGLLIPALILIVTFGLTLGSLHATVRPGRDPAATVRIIGHRWWWEIRYTDRDATKTIVTANEIHVPVGQPVRLELTSADVIHSFWIPQLAGKTDAIPGVTNVAWLEADTAGIYRGACTEYCGLQHANMAAVVVAEAPAAFAAWENGERAPASAPVDAASAAGLAVFERSACATCHAIRGTSALGRVGPDLTHLASRLTIAAGTLENTRGNLAGWIGNSQSLKPGNDMPVMPIMPDDFQALLAYLETLR